MEFTIHFLLLLFFTAFFFLFFFGGGGGVWGFYIATPSFYKFGTGPGGGKFFCPHFFKLGLIKFELGHAKNLTIQTSKINLVISKLR